MNLTKRDVNAAPDASGVRDVLPQPNPLPLEEGMATNGAGNSDVHFASPAAGKFSERGEECFLSQGAGVRENASALHTRRNFITTVSVGAMGLMAARFSSVAEALTNAATGPAPANLRYRIGVSDLMILKRQKLGAFQRTKEIGADGVEVDMGGLGNRDTFDNQLAKPDVREQFLATARELNLEICSLGMTGFFAQSFAERPTVPRMVQDCVDTMKAMNVKVAFLPLGVRGDLLQHPELRPAIVERLKLAGKIAADAGLVIGVETSLPAADEVKLLDEVGSPGVKSYFNFANAAKFGRDVSSELRTLGAERICQIHASNEDGVWLENDREIDVPKVKQTLDDLGWRGWLVIERSRDKNDPRNVLRNFGANTAYLKKVFQGKRS